MISILTDKEREIAHMIACGMTTAQIATARGVCEGTIDMQVRRICEKLGVKRRVQIAAEVGREAATRKRGV